jgi:predicted N-acyltransferase
MFFSLFYYICVDPFITKGLESIDQEGVGIHLSRVGWNPFITRGLESIYHEEVGTMKKTYRECQNNGLGNEMYIQII